MCHRMLQAEAIVESMSLVVATAIPNLFLGVRFLPPSELPKVTSNWLSVIPVASEIILNHNLVAIL